MAHVLAGLGIIRYDMVWYGTPRIGSVDSYFRFFRTDGEMIHGVGSR